MNTVTEAKEKSIPLTAALKPARGGPVPWHMIDPNHRARLLLYALDKPIRMYCQFDFEDGIWCGSIGPELKNLNRIRLLVPEGTPREEVQQALKKFAEAVAQPTCLLGDPEKRHEPEDTQTLDQYLEQTRGYVLKALGEILRRRENEGLETGIDAEGFPF
jgi:hypothetical protein